jgi:uncharacterized protein
MANQLDPRLMTPGRTGTADVAIDQGLRSYMLGVYNTMASGVLLTGLVSLAVSMSPGLMQLMFATPLKWVVLFAPLAMVMFLSFRVQKMSAGAVQATFWAFAAVMGASLAPIFLIYTGTSIAKVFFITAAAFGALSLWGYTTKKDLSGFGTFLVMGLFGLIIASIVNIFLKSSAMEFIISCVGVLVFAGLTAYDTQRIKEMYFDGDAADTRTKKITMGALSLYMDFINLFLMLLRLFGNRE